MEQQPNIKEYVELVHQGFSYEQIKAELKTQHPDIKTKTVRKVMNRIDREFEQIAKKEQDAHIVTTFFRLAGVVIAIGLLAVLYNFFNVGTLDVFSLGILGFGIALLLGGIARKSKTA